MVFFLSGNEVQCCQLCSPLLRWRSPEDLRFIIAFRYTNAYNHRIEIHQCIQSSHSIMSSDVVPCVECCGVGFGQDRNVLRFGVSGPNCLAADPRQLRNFSNQHLSSQVPNSPLPILHSTHHNAVQDTQTEHCLTIPAQCHRSRYATCLQVRDHGRSFLAYRPGERPIGKRRPGKMNREAVGMG
jgi:hypothetical protein